MGLSLQSHDPATFLPGTNLMTLKSGCRGHICPWMLTEALFRSVGHCPGCSPPSATLRLSVGVGWDSAHFLRNMEVEVQRVHWYLNLSLVPVSAVSLCSWWLSQTYPPLAHLCLSFFSAYMKGALNYFVLPV